MLTFPYIMYGWYAARGHVIWNGSVHKEKGKENIPICIPRTQSIFLCAQQLSPRIERDCRPINEVLSADRYTTKIIYVWECVSWEFVSMCEYIFVFVKHIHKTRVLLEILRLRCLRIPPLFFIAIVMGVRLLLFFSCFAAVHRVIWLCTKHIGYTTRHTKINKRIFQLRHSYTISASIIYRYPEYTVNKFSFGKVKFIIYKYFLGGLFCLYILVPECWKLKFQ